jgi:hypothetical protein
LRLSDDASLAFETPAVGIDESYLKCALNNMHSHSDCNGMTFLSKSSFIFMSLKLRTKVTGGNLFVNKGNYHHVTPRGVISNTFFIVNPVSSNETSLTPSPTHQPLNIPLDIGAKSTLTF